VRIAERLTVIAGDDDERVLFEAGAADRLEHPRDVPVGFVQHVQIAAEIVGVGHCLAHELDHRRARRRLVGMVRLLRPGHQEKRARRILLDELRHEVHGAAVFHAP
jgi:hypothetical protein